MSKLPRHIIGCLLVTGLTADPALARSVRFSSLLETRDPFPSQALALRSEEAFTGGEPSEDLRRVEGQMSEEARSKPFFLYWNTPWGGLVQAAMKAIAARDRIRPETLTESTLEFINKYKEITKFLEFNKLHNLVRYLVRELGPEFEIDIFIMQPAIKLLTERREGPGIKKIKNRKNYVKERAKSIFDHLKDLYSIGLFVQPPGLFRLNEEQIRALRKDLHPLYYDLSKFLLKFYVSDPRVLTEGERKEEFYESAAALLGSLTAAYHRRNRNLNLGDMKRSV
jgi:hypothetical protein